MTLLTLRHQGLQCHTMNQVNTREKWEQEELIKAPCALKFLAEGTGSGRMIEMSGDRLKEKEGQGDKREESKSGRGASRYHYCF